MRPSSRRCGLPTPGGINLLAPLKYCNVVFPFFQPYGIHGGVLAKIGLFTKYGVRGADEVRLEIKRGYFESQQKSVFIKRGSFPVKLGRQGRMQYSVRVCHVVWLIVIHHLSQRGGWVDNICVSLGFSSRRRGVTTSRHSDSFKMKSSFHAVVIISSFCSLRSGADSKPQVRSG
jgi:hypothetical protein